MRRVLLANMEVFVSSPSVSFSNSLFPDGSLVRDVLNRFVWQQGAASSADFYVVRNGRLSDLEEAVQPGAVYHLEPRLRGGKGGFGSMLRALGAQIEKTTNREACRDLSGRRLRDVNHEKEMAEWLKKQTEREAEKEQRRLERLQRKLKEPKHQFTDPEYQRQCHDLSERLEDSVMKGLQASCSQKTDDVSPAKRPNCDPSEQPQKKKQKKKNAAEACLWMRVDDMPGSEDEEDEEEDESLSSPSPSPSSCGSAAVAMPMQEVEREQSTSSSDASSDHQTPRPFEDHGPTQAPRDQTPKPPQDQGSPEAPRDQTPKPSQDQRASPHQDLVLVDLDLAQLESLGLDVLKGELMSRGLKCGGTLKERAQRLFSVRGLTPEQIDPALIAKPTKRK